MMLRAERRFVLRCVPASRWTEAKPGGMIKPWEVYKVHDKGALMPQGEFVFEKSEFACDKKITHPHDVRTICIREPEVVKKVWIGFSMNWWSDKIKGEVIDNLKAAGMVQVLRSANSANHVNKRC